MNPISSRARRLGLAAATLLACAVLPAAANAATISYDGSGALVYKAAPGEKNYLSYYAGQTRAIAVSDSGAGTIDYPAGSCEVGYVYYVIECDLPTSFSASLDDGDDIFNADKMLQASADGGPGKDTLRADINGDRGDRLSGGAGDDRITGGMGPDVLDGGDGVDEIGGRDGSDQIQGGGGDDKLLGDAVNLDAAADVIDGGPGFDTIDSDWKKNLDFKGPISVTLAGGADDGRAGENDDVRNVEHLFLHLPGTYTGSDANETIDINQVEQGSVIRGLGGDDHLESSDGDDTIEGGAGADDLDGGYGNDMIVGGPGQDRLHGDTQGGECSYIYCKNPFGNDTIDARDGEVDQIDCGVGTDRVLADVADVVGTDCETVERTGTPGPGPGPGPVGPGVTDPNSPALSARFVGVSLNKALKSGVKVKVTGPAGAKVTVKAKKGSKAVASGSGRLNSKGTGTITLKFSKAGKNSLKRSKKASLTVSITVKAPDGTVAKTTGKLTLKR